MTLLSRGLVWYTGGRKLAGRGMWDDAREEVVLFTVSQKWTDVLFKCVLGSPEITSYLLQSMTLKKLHSGSNVLSIDRSSTENHFLSVLSSSVTIFRMFSTVQKWWPFNFNFNLGKRYIIVCSTQLPAMPFQTRWTRFRSCSKIL
jgi:hypothetical protein